MMKMQYIFRKLLNPNNKKVFNSLLCEEHSAVYPNRWKENIKPLWKEINERYKFWTTNGKEPLTEEFDKRFINQFNKESFIPEIKSSVAMQREISQSKTDKVSHAAEPPFSERLKQAWNILKGNKL